MKKTALFLAAIGATGLSFAELKADGLSLSDNFNTYTPGNLVGQGNWLQTSTVTTNPIQVTGGAVVVGNTGQDVFKPFTGGTLTLGTNPATSATSVTATMDINVSAAAAAGDYFFHFTPTTTTTNIFIDRVFIKSSGTGFVLGLGSAASAAATYGTTVLSLSSIYTIATTYTVVAGTSNDTFDITVGGVSYLSGVVLVGTEPTTLASVAFRQGGGPSAAPSLTVDNLSVTYTGVPEPQEYGVAFALMLGALILFRRRHAVRA